VLGQVNTYTSILTRPHGLSLTLSLSLSLTHTVTHSPPSFFFSLPLLFFFLSCNWEGMVSG